MEFNEADLQAALRVFDAMCALRGNVPQRGTTASRGMYDADDFDADELGLDPEDDFE